MMTDPICLRQNPAQLQNPAWTVYVQRVARGMSFFVADSEGASSERGTVITEDTDGAIGFRLSLSLPCNGDPGLVQ